LYFLRGRFIVVTPFSRFMVAYINFFAAGKFCLLIFKVDWFVGG
jgi:hypothetical protein